MKKNIDNVQQPHILIKGRVMKILMINGSPRRTGNTALALQALEKKLQADHEVELLQSYSMTVTPCLACLECKKNDGFCVQRDDTNTMLQKINDAECIVFGTPVFWIGMSGQLKLFIDKFVARQNIFKQKPKKTVSVVVGGSGPKTRQYELIAEQFSGISNFLCWNHICSASFSAFGMGDIIKCPDFETKIQEIVTAINQ